MILFQVERYDSELHRPCPAAPHDPAMLRTIPLSRRGVYAVRGTSGSGFQLSLYGLFGILLAAREGLEVNLLGLSLGSTRSGRH